MKAGRGAVTECTLGHWWAIIGGTYSAGASEIVTGIADGAGGSRGGIPVAVGNSCLGAKTEE